MFNFEDGVPLTSLILGSFESSVNLVQKNSKPKQTNSFPDGVLKQGDETEDPYPFTPQDDLTGFSP